MKKILGNKIGLKVILEQCAMTEIAKSLWLKPSQNTLPAEMFGGSDFWLETRVIIKILKKMIPHIKPKVFFVRKKQKQKFFLKKKNQNGRLKKT